MAKSESPVIIRQKFKVESGKNTSIEGSIKHTCDRLCATGAAEDQEHPKLQNKRSMKFVMSLKTNHNQMFTPLQQLVPFHRQQHIE